MDTDDEFQLLEIDGEFDILGIAKFMFQFLDLGGMQQFIIAEIGS